MAAAGSFRFGRVARHATYVGCCRSARKKKDQGRTVRRLTLIFILKRDDESPVLPAAHYCGNRHERHERWSRFFLIFGPPASRVGPWSPWGPRPKNGQRGPKPPFSPSRQTVATASRLSTAPVRCSDRARARVEPFGPAATRRATASYRPGRSRAVGSRARDTERPPAAWRAFVVDTPCLDSTYPRRGRNTSAGIRSSRAPCRSTENNKPAPSSSRTPRCKNCTRSPGQPVRGRLPHRSKRKLRTPLRSNLSTASQSTSSFLGSNRTREPVLAPFSPRLPRLAYPVAGVVETWST